MPQMMPMKWTLMMLMTFLLFMFSIYFIYFIFMIKYNYTFTNMPYNNFNKWMWKW